MHRADASGELLAVDAFVCFRVSPDTWGVLLYGARRVAEGNVGLVYNSILYDIFRGWISLSKSLCDR